MGRRLQGRGRLSSIELLPDHAASAVAWAKEALDARSVPQTEILEQFNAQLAALDPPCPPISMSAFNRFSLRFSAQARKLREGREVAAALAERLDDLPEGDIGMMLIETIKTLINDILVDGVLSGESPSIKMLRDASEAVERLEKARKSSVETQQKARAAFVKKAGEAVDLAVREGKIDEVAAERARGIMGFA